MELEHIETLHRLIKEIEEIEEEIDKGHSNVRVSEKKYVEFGNTLGLVCRARIRELDKLVALAIAKFAATSRDYKAVKISLQTCQRIDVLSRLHEVLPEILDSRDDILPIIHRLTILARLEDSRDVIQIILDREEKINEELSRVEDSKTALLFSLRSVARIPSLWESPSFTSHVMHQLKTRKLGNGMWDSPTIDNIPPILRLPHVMRVIKEYLEN